MLLLVVLKSGYGSSLSLASDWFLNALQWKKYLTMMQIIQFVIDLFVVYFGSKFLFLNQRQIL